MLTQQKEDDLVSCHESVRTLCKKYNQMVYLRLKGKGFFLLENSVEHVDDY